MSDADLDHIFADFIVEASVLMDAPVDEVWRLVTDVERIGQFSPECVRVEWLDGPEPPEVGARFAGTNRWTLERLPPEMHAGLPDDWSFEWTLPCEVIASDRPRRFVYVVGDRFDGTPSTEWSFEIEPRDGSCLVTERMRHMPAGRSFNRWQAEQDPSRADQVVAERGAVLREDLRRTLLAMQAALETGTESA